jgi:CheY-like chemotaxis protein
MKTIFLVDDDGLMREMLTRTLRKHDLRVKAFSSPASLLQRFEFEYPHAIVSDINMPGMTGLDLLKTLRRRGSKVPVILMSAHLADDVVEQAEALGVDRMISKPIRDIDRFVSHVRRAVDDLRADAEGDGLDRMRFRFLINLSHELRTPLTAVKIALDGLFKQRGEAFAPPERRLVDIGQRNVDRIIRVVEDQLDLLRLALGDMSVERRLVDLNEIICEASGGDAGTQASDDPALRGRRICIFTDPDRLCSVLRHIFKPGDQGPVQHTVKLTPQSVRIEFRNTAFLEDAEPNGRTMDFLREPALAAGGRGFGREVCERLIQSLDGSIETMRDGERESIRLYLPLAARYDHDVDFERPLASLRKAATLSGRGLTLVRCRVVCEDQTAPVTQQLLRRCLATMSEGDMLVRGRQKNTYFLALLARDPEQVDNVLSFLREPVAPESESFPDQVQATVVRSILPGEMPAEDLLPVLETV